MNIHKIGAWFKFLTSKFGINGLKGIYAEILVSKYLKYYFPRSKLLNNVTLPYGTYTTQIDHILINEFGIFVIEVKNYKGYITATEKYDQWFVKYSNHKWAKSYKINSPLHQNIAHCKAVADILNLPHSEPINIISFSKRANVHSAKGEFLPNICVGDEIVNYIKTYQQPRYTTEQVEEFNQRLWANRLIPSLSTDFFHVNNIQQKLADREESRLERERQKVRDVNSFVRAQADIEHANIQRGRYEDVRQILQPGVNIDIQKFEKED